jgi:hypothetical protein
MRSKRAGCFINYLSLERSTWRHDVKRLKNLILGHGTASDGNGGKTVKTNSKTAKIVSIFSAVLFIYACSHPIEIVGEGDVLSASGDRDCLLEDFVAGLENCSKNYVIDEYVETYYAVPRSGWQFDHWASYCTNAIGNECSFNAPSDTVHQYWGGVALPLRAVFTTIGNRDTVAVPGREWLQVDLFLNLSWNDIIAVCPVAAGGVCTNGGVLNGYNMTGWTWASVDDVNALFNHYIGSEELGPGPDEYETGIGNTTWATAFFNDWRGFDLPGFSVDTTPGLVGWVRNLVNEVEAYNPFIGVAVTIDGDDAINTGYSGDIEGKGEYLGGWFYRIP